MPIVSEFIDQFRAVFGADVINAAIVDGLQEDPLGPRFYANEGGVEIGRPNDGVGVVPFLPKIKESDSRDDQRAPGRIPESRG